MKVLSQKKILDLEIGNCIKFRVSNIYFVNVATIIQVIIKKLKVYLLMQLWLLFFLDL